MSHHIYTRTCLLCMASGSALGLQAQEAQYPQHEVAAGGYYSRGDYGQLLDTSLYYFPLSYERSFEQWKLQLSVPHLQISGAGNVLVNVGGIGRYDKNAQDFVPTAQTHRGIGDTVLKATYQLPAWSQHAPFIDVGLELKLPTADENKGLGTGAYDSGVQLDAYQQLGQTTLFATLGYKFRGQSTLFSQMRDSAFVSLGFSNSLGDRLSYGLIYDFREAAASGSGETHELLPYVSLAVASQWTLMSYVVKGFTQDSADKAIGVQLSYRW